jgi:hypothetical protein
MRELNKRQWAVISERGSEATNLSYEEAAQLARELARARIYGLCVVTNEAAARLTGDNQQTSSPTEMQSHQPKPQA